MADKRPLTLNANGTKELLQPGNSLDIGGYTVPNVAGAVGNHLVMGASNSEWQELNNAYEKTGWDESVFSEVTLTFTDGTRTVAIAPTDANASYYIAGTKYTFTVEQTVVIDDTEGMWYIYFNGSTLTASQVNWTYDETRCPVMNLYWDATNNVNIGWQSDLHSWLMQQRLHNYLHNTFGTRFDRGLGVAEATTSTVNVAIGKLFDEDVEAEITDEVGSGWWDQVLSPLTAPIYYRTGAGLWRKIAASTSLCYLDTNIPQVNIFSGTWQWAAVGVARYFAYWVVASSDTEYPVYIVPGQESADKLSDTIAGNLLADMDFGGLPTEEHKVIARLILRRTGSGAFYEITQIDDYRYAKDENAGAGTTVSDHGGLTGLADDDHAQYHNDARAAAWINAGFTTTGNVTIDSDSNGLVLGDDADYNIKWDGSNAVHTILITAAFEFDGGAIRLPNVTTTQRDALTPANGMAIYNSTDNQFQMYEDGAWVQKATAITEALDLYVATDGDDTTGDGSISLPWATIDKALAVVGGWVLLADVTINIEKGDYTETSDLIIDHPNGNFLNIIGDSVEETLTMTASGGSTGAYWYTFATTNTDDYTVGDETLNYEVTGGSNRNFTLGVLTCSSKINGVSVTLQSQYVGGTRATGAVVAKLVTPQVQWIRLITIKSSLANLEGIQQQYNALTTFTYFLLVDATDTSTVYINNYVAKNTNASKWGTCRNYPNSFVTFTKFGVRNLSNGFFTNDIIRLFNCCVTGCSVGIRAYGLSKLEYDSIVLTSNTLAIRVDNMAYGAKRTGTRTLVGNGADASPAFGSQGNNYAYMSA